MAKIICKIEFSAYGHDRYVSVVCGTKKQVVRYRPEYGSCESQVEVLRRMDLKDLERVIDDFSSLASIIRGRYLFEEKKRV